MIMYSSERLGIVLDSITKLIKSEIKRQYKSVRQFSEKSGIPYSTLSNALSKGIGGTSYDTVIKICKLLNLKQAYDADLTIFNDQFYEICAMLAALDERGVHTVKTILSVEYNRCTNGESTQAVKAYNGLSVAGGSIEIDGSTTTRMTLHFQRVDEELLELLGRFPAVRSCTRHGDAVALVLEKGDWSFSSLVTELSNAGQEVIGAEIEKPSLESVFLQLTGKKLRD